MNITFANAPLVELIAEIRWGADAFFQENQPPGTVIPMMIDPSRLDEFFMRFGGEVYQHGFQRAERIVPSGFPMVFNQPVFRYRKSTAADDSVLYQTGLGLFTANAIPPYRSWENFAPIIQNGIDALIKSRIESEREQPFNRMSLRYINAFGPSLTREQDAWTFIKDVLGFKIELPNGLSKVLVQGESIKPNIQFAMTVADNLTMNLVVAEGLVNNEINAILDITVTKLGGIAADTGVVMQAFHAIREVTHNLFFDLTAPIHELMQPANKE